MSLFSPAVRYLLRTYLSIGAGPLHLRRHRHQILVLPSSQRPLPTAPPPMQATNVRLRRRRRTSSTRPSTPTWTRCYPGTRRRSPARRSTPTSPTRSGQGPQYVRVVQGQPSTFNVFTCGEAVGYRTPFLLYSTLFDELLLLKPWTSGKLKFSIPTVVLGNSGELQTYCGPHT